MTTASVSTVSELTRRIKSHLEPHFTDIAVRGEISNYRQYPSGHAYFTLKDEQSQLPSVMWRSRVQALRFAPADGMKVLARGNITVYEVRGNYQLDASFLEPLGAGELQLAFERLKARLAAEGLFDQSRKKPIPRFPSRICLITSGAGAAVQDLVTILSRRYPPAGIVLIPVKVQGSGAAGEIARAIADANEAGGIDTLIVGRGGGSPEDLWAFNEEEVARAIARSRIPVISAVGHETDFTIADFVADLRAPTPSAAAELAVPDRLELVDVVRNYCYTAARLVAQKLAADRDRIVSLVRSYSFNRPVDLLRQRRQRIDECRRTLDRSALHHAALARRGLDALAGRLSSVNPAAVLERGYALVLRSGQVVPRAAALAPADDIRIAMHDGEVPAVIAGPPRRKGGKR